jgi:hypothetical protein
LAAAFAAGFAAAFTAGFAATFFATAFLAVVFFAEAESPAAVFGAVAILFLLR